MSDEPRQYHLGALTVHWQPAKCQHSGICAAGLPLVFDPKRRPWIDLSQATEAQIAEQVRQCPSGALSLTPPAAVDLPGATLNPDDEKTNPGVSLSEVEAAAVASAGVEQPSTDENAQGGADDEEEEATTDETLTAPAVTPMPNGPLLVDGTISLRLPNGEVQVVEKCALCRCGGSANKPFCDGSHSKNGFTA